MRKPTSGANAHLVGGLKHQSTGHHPSTRRTAPHPPPYHSRPTDTASRGVAAMGFRKMILPVIDAAIVAVLGGVVLFFTL